MTAMKEQFGDDFVTRPKDFVQHWSDRIEKADSSNDAKRSGRKRKVSDQVAKQAAEIFSAGKSHGAFGTAHYANLAEGLSGSSKLRELKEKQDCSMDTFLRAMKRAEPDLRCIYE